MDIRISIKLILGLAAAALLAWVIAAKAAEPSVTARLTTSKAAVEVTALPAGTDHVGVAVMKDEKRTGLKEGINLPAKTGEVYTPPAEDPVVDLVAKNAAGQSIGVWYSQANGHRLVTVPGGVNEPPAEEPKPEEPPHEEGPKGSLFTPGIVQGTEPADLAGDSVLHPRIARVEFGLSSANLAERISAVEAQLAAKGVVLQPLLGFSGRVPSAAESKTQAAKAASVKGVRLIEFGNETSFGYQYGDGSSKPSYTARARAYAVDVKEAAIAASSYGVGVLAQADDGGSGNSVWVDQMFSAVPALATYVNGWVIHPYGTGGPGKLERMVAQLAKHGEKSKPVDVTEWGIASDNGRTLSDNYGWPRNLTYPQAGTLLPEAVGKLKKIAGARLRSFELYQVRDQKEHGASSEREAYFGALQRNGAAKGAYTTAVQRLESE